MGIRKTGKPSIKYSYHEVFRQSIKDASFFTITVALTFFNVARNIMGMFVILFSVTLILSLIWNRFKGEMFIDFEELRYNGDFNKLILELENNGLSLQRKVDEYYFFKVGGLVSTLPEVRVTVCGDHCILSVAEILKGRFASERFISRDCQEVANSGILDTI